MTDDASLPLLARADIERGGGEPPYRQIVRLFHDAVVAGELRAGTRLPPERALAAALGVGRATVARALGELAETGLLERRVGHGTIVAFDPETWRAGPTAGIPWGVMVTAFPPSSQAKKAHAADAARRAAIAERFGSPNRDAESVILTAGIEDGTRFLVESLLRADNRVIVEAPSSPTLALSLAMRGVEAIEVGSSAPEFASGLERLLDGQPGATLIWLRSGGALRRRGERAHLAGLTKRLGLPLVEEPPGGRATAGLLGVEPHDHVIRLDHEAISAPAPLARLLRPLASALGIGAASDS